MVPSSPVEASCRPSAEHEARNGPAMAPQGVLLGSLLALPDVDRAVLSRRSQQLAVGGKSHLANRPDVPGESEQGGAPWTFPRPATSSSLPPEASQAPSRRYATPSTGEPCPSSTVCSRCVAMSHRTIRPSSPAEAAWRPSAQGHGMNRTGMAAERPEFLAAPAARKYHSKPRRSSSPCANPLLPPEAPAPGPCGRFAQRFGPDPAGRHRGCDGIPHSGGELRPRPYPPPCASDSAWSQSSVVASSAPPMTRASAARSPATAGRRFAHLTPTSSMLAGRASSGSPSRKRLEILGESQARQHTGVPAPFRDI